MNNPVPMMEPAQVGKQNGTLASRVYQRLLDDILSGVLTSYRMLITMSHWKS
jgi:DNA-binding GntR family transcriptional regulator